MKTATFRGTTYSIEMGGSIDGLTDSPRNGGKPTLMLFVPLNERRGLTTAIHEALHACSFLKDEEAVTETAEDRGHRTLPMETWL